MAKLTNAELKALAEQLTQKLNQAESKRYDAAKKDFEKRWETILQTAPVRKYVNSQDILNRLIIKQIDIKDVTDLMKAVEKDLK